MHAPRHVCQGRAEAHTLKKMINISSRRISCFVERIGDGLLQRHRLPFGPCSLPCGLVESGAGSGDRTLVLLTVGVNH